MKFYSINCNLNTDHLFRNLNFVIKHLAALSDFIILLSQKRVMIYLVYTEHCSIGPTNL